MLEFLLEERLLLIACRVAHGLLLEDLDEVGSLWLPLNSLQGKIGILKGFL